MDGVWTAAWPLIRTDLQLSYTQVGLLLALPSLLGNLIEPAFGVLGDAWNRRALIRAGGVAFAAAPLLIALSDGFVPLLAALSLFSPASGAFVGLSQATLMDADPRRHELNMARWALAGSIGVLAGPLLLGAAVSVGLGWRAAFAALAAAAGLLLALVWRTPTAASAIPATDAHAVADRRLGAALARGARGALAALRRREVLRWLTLLELADLMLDVLHGFLGLYFVDVVGVSGARAALAVGVWAGVGLVGDALLIPLLARVSGMRYLRASALAVLCVFPAFLLAPGMASKLALLGVLGLLNAGWYSILKGRLYSEMPGQSATVMTLGNLFGLAGSLLPLAVGLLAERFGLAAAMWLPLLAPVALLVGLPGGARHAGGAEPTRRGADRAAPGAAYGKGGTT